MTEILVIRPQSNQLGDTICTLPMYKALKTKYPDAKITLVGCPTNYKINFKKLNPWLDEIIIFRKDKLSSLLAFLIALRKKKYDIVMVPSSIRISYTSYLIALLARGKIKAGVGRMDSQKNRLSFFLDVKPEYDWSRDKVHQVNRFLDTAKALGCPLPDEEVASMRIKLNPVEEEYGNNYIAGNFPDRKRKIVVFHPGAGQKRNTWDVNKYFELIKLISEKYNPYIVVSSGFIDRQITDSLESMLGAAGIEYSKMVDVPAFQLAAILKHVTLFVCNNTGVMHLASFNGTNTLAFFFKDDSFEWSPYFMKGEILESPSSDINLITAEQAFEKAKRFFEAGA